MAYTSPRQWLNLLRSRPGSRFTDLGQAGNVLDATGSWMQRNSANPDRDWRDILAEGEQRRQQSESYGTPGSAISQVGGGGSSSGYQPTARRESYTDILKRAPGSAVTDPEDPVVGDVPQDPQSFLGKVGSFFTQPGVADAMISGGSAMAQAASQPGASFWGSLGAGGEAALDQHNLMQEQQAARDKLAADATLGPDQREQAARGLIELYGGDWTPQQIASAVQVARASDEGLEIISGQLAPDGDGSELATSLEETEALDALAAEVFALESIPEEQRTPEQITELAAKKRRLQYMERATDTADPVPPTPPAPSNLERELEFIAETQGYDSAKAAQTDWANKGLGDWQRTHMAQARGVMQPDQYRGRTPSRGQIAAETRRIAAYDEWFLEGRGAQFEKNLDTFNEVMFDLDQRIAAQELEGSSDWENDGGGGFAQALKGAMVQRMPFMAAAQVAEDANTLDLVRAVVFQSLKETLGGQFAEREAENLVRAAYNPMLPPGVNKRRIQRLMTELRSTDHYMESMKDYYERTGELAFYTHQNAEAAWNLALQTGQVEGLGSSIINPLEYGGLGEEEIAEAMKFDLGNLTPEERGALAYKLSGGRPFSNLEQALDPLAYQMILAIRNMGR